MHMTIDITKLMVLKPFRRVGGVQRVRDLAGHQPRGQTAALTRNNRIKRAEHA
jgi:hypothetical protein